MMIGGKSYTGVQLRSLLGLNSTAFTMEVKDGNIVVTTKGKGHRVGMSQYGADAMAVTGCTYEQILQHYYQGTVIDKMDRLG
jgi:stage II sporulation protein D